MTWPKAMFSIELYDPPKKGDWHKAKYLVHCPQDGLWTDSLDDALQHLRSFIVKITGEDVSDEQLVSSFIMKPVGKIKLKETKGNRGDSKWHTVTGYMLQDLNYYDDDDDPTMFMMFSLNGIENDQGVTVRINGELSDGLMFKDVSSGRPLTAKEAVDIILGNTQQKEKKNGRHNDKKADRRKVQKVRPVRDRVERDPKLVRLPNKRSKNSD